MKFLITIILCLGYALGAESHFAGAKYEITKEINIAKSLNLADFTFELKDHWITTRAYVNVYYQGELMATQDTIGLEGTSSCEEFIQLAETMQQKYPNAKVYLKTSSSRNAQYPEIKEFIILTE